ncbi:MAG TPA: hypothetical protein VH025_07425 [Solirubrobacteraceae bacterium]|jgi:hypothetical protein|nr:hypothetical protein [Solirubrobacteraceae bacterium]
MPGNFKQRTAVGVALAAVIAGIVIAIIGTGAHHPAKHRRHGHGGLQQAFARAGSGQHGLRRQHRERRDAVRAAAKYLGSSRAAVRRKLHSGETLGQIAAATSGKSQDGLVEAIVSAQAPRLEAAATKRKTSQAKVAARLSALRAAASKLVSEVFAGGAVELTVAARYLGLPVTQVLAERRAGKSLAELARATPSRSSAGLIAALIKARTTALDQALKQGRITRKHEQVALAALPARVRSAVLARPAKARGKPAAANP